MGYGEFLSTQEQTEAKKSHASKMADGIRSKFSGVLKWFSVGQEGLSESRSADDLKPLDPQDEKQRKMIEELHTQLPKFIQFLEDFKERTEEETRLLTEFNILLPHLKQAGQPNVNSELHNTFKMLEAFLITEEFRIAKNALIQLGADTQPQEDEGGEEDKDKQKKKENSKVTLADMEFTTGDTWLQKVKKLYKKITTSIDEKGTITPPTEHVDIIKLREDLAMLQNEASNIPVAA